jgi:3-hydroxybutyryl-CoA dehydrogenase
VPTFNKISVLGLGAMGTGIAQICAQAGSSVVAYDAFPDAVRQVPKRIEKDLKKAVELGKITSERAEETIERIAFTTQIEDCEGSELVIESVSEKLDLKIQVLSQLDERCPPPAIYATDTSSLSVTAIAAKSRFPERVCGMHFFHPVPRTKLVEIIATEFTDKSNIDLIKAYSLELGKTPVFAKDSPGFIVNRVARPYFGEALRCLDEGVADFALIDEILREGGGFKRGPFELMDLIGIDITYAVSKSIWEARFHDSRYRPHPIQKKMIEAGHIGKKSRRGFYEYSDE